MVEIRLSDVERSGKARRLATRGRRPAALAALLTSLLFPSIGAAQENALPPSVSVVVPVVGNIPGNGVRWVTSVQLRNDTGSAVDVWLVLPATADALATSLSMRAGETLLMRDVIREAFGVDTALSPLQVITSGRRSVSIGVTIHAVRGTEIIATQFVPIDYGRSSAPVRVLPGLAFSDEQRTNVGLVNLSLENDASFILALQRIAGRNITLARITLPPATLVHTPIQSLFPMIAKGSDFTVVIESGDPETYVYASVIDNESSFARYVRPSAGVPILTTGPK